MPIGHCQMAKHDRRNLTRDEMAMARERQRWLQRNHVVVLAFRAALAFCSWTLLIPDALSTDNTAVMAFARANVDKFRTEPVVTKGITYGTNVTVSFVDNEVSLYWSYDLDKGELVHHGLGLVGDMPQLAPDHCVDKGSFLGQNSYGAKFTVRRRECERFWIGFDMQAFYKNGGPAEVQAPIVKMSPSVYRKIQKDGIRAESDFTIGNPSEQELVRYSDETEPATAAEPYEDRMKVWTVYAKVKQIRWFIPEEGTPVVIWTATD